MLKSTPGNRRVSANTVSDEMGMKMGISTGADGGGGDDDNDDADWLTTVVGRRRSPCSTATGTDETGMSETVIDGRELDGTFGVVTTNDDGRDCCSRHRR